MRSDAAYSAANVFGMGVSSSLLTEADAPSSTQLGTSSGMGSLPVLALGDALQGREAGAGGAATAFAPAALAMLTPLLDPLPARLARISDPTSYRIWLKGGRMAGSGLRQRSIRLQMVGQSEQRFS